MLVSAHLTLACVDQGVSASPPGTQFPAGLPTGIDLPLQQSVHTATSYSEMSE